MKSMADRMARLRLTQAQIVARLDDPKTPAYSVAPLTNQLRLVARDLARLTPVETDQGLPDPERFGAVTAFAYARWLRGPLVPPRRRPGGYADRVAQVFGGWRNAGFVLLPRAAGDGVDGWVEANRTRLLEILQGGGPASAGHVDKGEAMESESVEP